MKKQSEIQGIWLTCLVLATLWLIGKIINQAWGGQPILAGFAGVVLLSPLLFGLYYVLDQLLDRGAPFSNWKWLLIFTVYLGMVLTYDVPRAMVESQQKARQMRLDFEKASPRRFVDKEAQVVCYESREFDGDRPALYCLPLSQTALKANAT